MSSCKTAIMSSKLFLASNADKRKKILAALANPINIELVEQLDEYIGDEYMPTEPEDVEVTENDTADAVDNQDSERSTSDNPKAIRPSAPNKSLYEKHKDELREDEDWEDDSTSGTNDSAEVTEKSETDVEVESAENISGEKIVAETTTLNPMPGVHNTINKLAFEVQGLLNAKADTAGVTRVNLKNDELWVYYGDEVNLNNVLTEAINSLNAASYTYLVFNRLARTDNAVVFTLSLNDTDIPVKPDIKTDEK